MWHSNVWPPISKLMKSSIRSNSDRLICGFLVLIIEFCNHVSKWISRWNHFPPCRRSGFAFRPLMQVLDLVGPSWTGSKTSSPWILDNSWETFHPVHEEIRKLRDSRENVTPRLKAQVLRFTIKTIIKIPCMSNTEKSHLRNNFEPY